MTEPGIGQIPRPARPLKQRLFEPVVGDLSTANTACDAWAYGLGMSGPSRDARRRRCDALFGERRESGETFEEVVQHRCIGFGLGPGDRIPLAPNAPLPLSDVRWVVGHDVQLALVLTKASHDAAGSFPAVDGDPDLLVRDPAHVVRLCRVKGVEPQFGALAVPPFEH